MPYLNYWERKGKAEGLVEGKAEGLVEGKAEGLIKGMAEGRIKGKVKTLHRQINAKYGQMPDWAEEKLFGAEETALDAWALNILTEDCLEDVFSS